MKIILRERNNQALVKIVTLNRIGTEVYKGTRFELWYDLDKMKKGIPGEFIEGRQYIYCSGYAGADEQELINEFDRNNPPA